MKKQSWHWFLTVESIGLAAEFVFRLMLIPNQVSAKLPDVFFITLPSDEKQLRYHFSLKMSCH